MASRHTVPEEVMSLPICEQSARKGWVVSGTPHQLCPQASKVVPNV